MQSTGPVDRPLARSEGLTAAAAVSAPTAREPSRRLPRVQLDVAGSGCGDRDRPEQQGGAIKRWSSSPKRKPPTLLGSGAS